ncbi:G-box-binding factor 1 [Pyrus x bretschneideri]|uniref:G-box-binding factor 1 n=1 Tax=Pyrus x bretschneideri TaxID=225117 RepID=UPI002030C0C3|nr:G-box-binding factor 1 [Pyrus x bretschneideri]
MGTRESSAASTQVVAFEMQKEELILDEYTESLIIYKGGSVRTDFVGKRVAEGEKTTCISGNNCDGASQSATSRGEDSSDKNREDYEQRMERRRLANREAARRSRIRRQQECEKLRATAEILESEIAQIPRDIWRLSEQIEKLKEENDSIFDELEKKYGADAVSDLRAVKDSLEGKGKDTDPKTPSRDS